MILLRLFLGLLVTWMFGHLVVTWFDKKHQAPLFESIALSYLVGQGLITLLLFFLFLLPLTNYTAIAALLIVGLFHLSLLRNRRRRLVRFMVILRRFRRFFRVRRNRTAVLLFLVLLIFFSIKITYSFVETLSKPEYAWDASGNWTLVGENVFHAEQYHSSKVVETLREHVSGYPRGVSLMHYWLFSFMGEANDQWSKIIFPLTLLCLLIIFYYGLKPLRGAWGALIFTYLLCSVPIFLYHSTIGYADLLKTAYFAAGIIYFYRFLQTKRSAYFWYFALLLAITTWLKMEGKALYAIGFALLLFYLWRDGKEPIINKLRYAARYLLLFVIIGLPWQLFLMFNKVQNLQGMLRFSFFEFFNFHKILYNLMFLEGSWGLFWVLAVAVLLFFLRRQIARPNLYLLIAILLFYGNLLFIYLCYHNAVSAMVATFNRVLLPIYPVVVFDLGCILPALKINKEIKI